MRIAVTGASGNLGTSLVRSLLADDDCEAIVAIARRPPADSDRRVRWVAADVRSHDLRREFEGMDAVVHLAWAIQPARDREHTRSVNVDGSKRVFEAASASGVSALVHASSIGAYSPVDSQDQIVGESWPTGGVDSSFYSSDKAAAERLLDEVEAGNPGLRVIRLRPALIMKRSAGAEVRRLFAGPLFPNQVLGRSLPVLPWIRGLRVQLVHTDDVAEAFRLAVRGAGAGAFNIAAGPILDGRRIAAALGARLVEVPKGIARAGADLTWRLRLQPTPAGWVDMGTSMPMMSTARAEDELGWQPRYGAEEVLLEILAGISEGAGEPTPALSGVDSLRGRIGELVQGTPRP